MKKMINRCLDLFYPPKCVFCDALLQPGELYYCRSCGEKIPLAEEKDLCVKGVYFDRCIAPLYYQDMVRESFLDFKFHDKTWRAATYAAFLHPYIWKQFPKLDIVTWVPLSRRSQKDRGYDQAQLVAKELAKLLGLPCEKLVEKVRDTQQQSRLDQAEGRRANVLGAYAPKKNISLKGRSVLLVDDVITTGSTMDECARILVTAGAEEVHAAAIAQAVGKVAKSAVNSPKVGEQTLAKKE